LRLTVRLGKGALRLEAEVCNPDTKPLPWGLGYHPYFRLPFAGTSLADDCTVEVPAAEYWVLGSNLPVGERQQVDHGRDLNRQRRVGELHLDDILTALPARPSRMDGLTERAALWGASGGPLRLFCSAKFREMVVFTPPHRQAFCVEPYTCPTDAVNLEGRLGNVGWEVLPPGGRAALVIELWV
jgi:aldose 1-epimerase